MENQEQTKHKLMAFGCLIAAIVIGVSSTAYTVMLFESMATGDAKKAAVAIGIAFDFGKYAFSTLAALQYTKNKFLSSLTFALLAIVLIGISFFASQAYDLNHNNKILNKSINESAEYKRKNTTFDSIQSSIKSDQKELDNLRVNKNNMINEAVKGLEDQKNSLPSDYITRKGQIQKQIDELKASENLRIDNRIKELEENIKKYQKQLENTDNSFEGLENTVNTTEGIYALAKMLDSKNPDAMLQKMTKWKNIILEVVGIAFAVAFGIYLGKGFKGNGKGIFNKIKNATSAIGNKIGDIKEKKTVVAGFEPPNQEDKKKQ
jgi:phage shock protein A